MCPGALFEAKKFLLLALRNMNVRHDRFRLPSEASDMDSMKHAGRSDDQ